MPDNYCDTPETLEKMFRSSESNQTLELLREAFNGCVVEGRQYNAYALAMDYFDLAKPLLDELAEAYEHDFLYEVFVLLCCEKDKSRAIALAVILVDRYSQNAEYEVIMDVSWLLINTFQTTRDTTQGIIILKAAINAAICIVEEITTEFPSDETATIICETLSLLPVCFQDADFMLNILNRIAACYTSEYEPKLVTIAAFLPAVEQGLDMLTKHFEGNIGVGGMNDEDLQGIIKVCNEYWNILFAVEHPQIAKGDAYKLNADTTSVDKHLAMTREEQDLSSALMNLAEENKDMLPELRERYERLIDYFTNFDNPTLLTEMEVMNHLVFCIVTWRKIDIDYALKTVEPYVQKLLDFEPDEATKTGITYFIQTNLTCISEIYAYVEDAAREYECHIKFLKLGNLYLKRICFENGIDYFLENTKHEYLYHHYALASAAQLAQAHKFPVDEFYFELCKRKNIFYLGEMWQRQGSNAVEIHKLLRKDFTLADLKAAIPADSILIDFFYARVAYKYGEFDELQADSRKNSTCIAFTLTANADVKIHFVSDGVKLAENMHSDEFTPYFKWITERLLADTDGISRILVCTEGDLNRLSFAALPHLDGFVTDKYAARNIAGVCF